jgi:hypothetical protein
VKPQTLQQKSQQVKTMQWEKIPTCESSNLAQKPQKLQ